MGNANEGDISKLFKDLQARYAEVQAKNLLLAAQIKLLKEERDALYNAIHKNG